MGGSCHACINSVYVRAHMLGDSGACSELHFGRTCPPHHRTARRRGRHLGHAGGQFRAHVPGDGAGQRRLQPDRFLVAPRGLEEPDADARIPTRSISCPSSTRRTRARGAGDSAGRRGFDHRQHRRRLAGGARRCRPGRRGQGQGRQISDPPAGLQGAARPTAISPCRQTPTRALRLLRSNLASGSAPTSPRRSPMASGSSSIRFRKPPTLRRRHLSTRSTSFSTARSPMTCASSRRSTASCSENRGWSGTRLMIDQLKSIGIEKGKPFNPDAKTQEMLNDSASRSPYLARCKVREPLSRRRLTTKAAIGRCRRPRRSSKACDAFRQSGQLSGRWPRRRLHLWVLQPETSRGGPVLSDDHQGQQTADPSMASRPIA